MIRAPYLPGLLALLLGVLSMPALHAASVGNLYGAVVPVADRSQAETDRGVVRALGVVLVKLTGQRSVLTEPAGRQLLKQAARYVTVVGHEADGNGVDAYRLRVDFDARAVAGALREQGAILWGAQRPQTRAWLVLEDAQGRRFAPDPASPDVTDPARAQAGERGIPLVFGQVDTGLQARVASALPDSLLAAILGETQPPAAAASAPVSAPVETPLLAGVLATADGLTWQGRWRILIEGVATDWENRADTPEALVADGVDRAADALGRHFADPAVFGGGVASVPLAVQGIATANDYGRVVSLLRGLDAVTALGVTRVAGTEVTFDIAARGGLSALTQNLRLSALLVPNPAQPGTYALNPTRNP
jgi:uncharacterized protein